ncbi:hypothetical protein EUX98_g6391 [Antrodiella citrinella]|uniref:F-box domain-containing protein n=1 Tax=Antrodiella citrinella TaxID=2447956 RepID=A0A4S4MP33_9APHY|nr:hypothetical protein EUX98_g6391 [Antrodiella citrinella]
MIYCHERPQRAKGDDLPNELLLQIYPHLSLQSLIAARSVDRRWRALVFQAYIPPARKNLLELYLHCLDTPAFLESRADIIPNLRTFDRDAYMNFLPPDPPDEFNIWVREWPACGVTGWTWPGLITVGTDRTWKFSCRCNCLGHCPPFIKNITFHERIKNAVSDSIIAEADSKDDVIYHATTYLPVGTDITLASGGISWLDEEESGVVSIELTVLCVCTCTADGKRYWYVLDGKRGGEKLKGIVYLGDAGMDLKSEDVVARSWSQFLKGGLEVAERIDPDDAEETVLPIDHDHILHSPKVRVPLLILSEWLLIYPYAQFII